MRRLIIAACAAFALSLTGCGEGSTTAPTQKQLQTQAAAKAASEVKFNSGNAELDNIKRRLELTLKPGAIGFILLLNEAGQPIVYTSVKGKITSSGKRLTPGQELRRADCGEYCNEILADAASDEGTYGSSDPYIYFWTVEGQYMQWSGRYLYSDQPIRTRIEPLVISVE